MPESGQQPQHSVTDHRPAAPPPEPVLRRLLPPLLIVFVLLVGGAFSFQLYQYRQDLAESNSRLVSGVAEDLQRLLAEQENKLRAIEEVLARDEKLLASLQAGNRQELFDSFAPLFARLRAEHAITHFYFIDPQRICLLRLHNPEKFGDRLDRFTAVAAAQSDRSAAGIELGPLGTFTLRVVRPLYVDGRLIGFLELGKEIEGILAEISRHAAVDLLLTLKKAALSRKTWETGMRILGREADWDQFADDVLAYSTFTTLPETLHSLVGPDGPAEAVEKTFAGRSWSVLSVPMDDVAGIRVGDLLVLRDITAIKAAAWKVSFLFGGGGLLLLGGLLLFLFLLLRRTDRGIAAQQAELWQSRDRLRVSEARYREFFEKSPDAYLTMEEGLFTDCNDAALAILAASREQVVGRRVTDFSPELQPDGTPSGLGSAERLQQVLESGSIRFEWLHRRLDGNDIWVDVSLALLSPLPRPTTLATLRDISDRKRAEAITALRLRLIDYAVDHNLGQLLVRVLDEVGLLLESPIGFYHFVEADQQTISLQQWSTATLRDFCRADGKGGHYPIDQAGVWVDSVRTGKTVVHNDYSSLPGKKGLPPGHAQVIREVVVPVIRQGRLVAIFGLGNKPVDYTPLDVETIESVADVSWEIIERKRGEERLRAEEVRIRAISESAHDAIIMIDPQGNVSFWNPAAERIFGYRPAEVIGRNLHHLLVPERYHAAHEKAYPLFLQSGQGAVVGQTLELAACHQNGQEIDVELSLSALQLADGWHAVGLMRDISDRKRMERELSSTNQALQRQTEVAREMAERAEMANIAKSEFLANMSHEIRTPMNGVMGMTGLLLDTPLSEEQRRYAEVVLASSESLLGLLNDILDFSKIEAGKLDLEVLPFDLFSLLDDVTTSLAVRANEKGLELLYRTDPEVPTLLRGDPGRLRQVLNNLVGNAIKFTEAGEVEISVSLEEESAERALLHLTVRDMGIGIPAEKIPLLFRKFTQVDASTTRKYGGTGLGLAICKQLVELMGGRIGVESAEGRGSEFWFTADLGKQVHQLRTEMAPPAALEGVRVLVVDDNSTNREIVITRLTAWKMRPEEVDSGAAALTALHRGVADDDPFRLAVIDMQMPGMDGESLGRTIMADRQLVATRLVMLTSLGARGDARRFAEIGFSAYLTKPVRHRELRSVLALALNGEAGQMGEMSSLVTRHTARETAALYTGRPARLLLAEDNITNQQVALGILKKLGLSADAVVNGAEAVKAVASTPYDLVLMDIQMPLLDGLAATRQIRAREAEQAGRRLPIVAMTAHAMQGDREACLAAGMDDYLSKPVELSSLVAVLNRWLPVVPADDGSLPADDGSVSAGNEMVPADNSVARQSTEPATPVWDRTALLGRLMDDQELAAVVIAAFGDDMPLQLAALKAALAAGDKPALASRAHGIKGAAANIGAEVLRGLALAMEKAAKGGDLAAAASLLPQLVEGFDQFQQAVASDPFPDGGQERG